MTQVEILTHNSYLLNVICYHDGKRSDKDAKPVKIITKEKILTVPGKTLSTESPFILLNERMHSISMHDKQRYISVREQVKLHEEIDLVAFQRATKAKQSSPLTVLLHAHFPKVKTTLTMLRFGIFELFCEGLRPRETTQVVSDHGI